RCIHIVHNRPAGEWYLANDLDPVAKRPRQHAFGLIEQPSKRHSRAKLVLTWLKYLAGEVHDIPPHVADGENLDDIAVKEPHARQRIEVALDLHVHLHALHAWRAPLRGKNAINLHALHGRRGEQAAGEAQQVAEPFPFPKLKNGRTPNLPHHGHDSLVERHEYDVTLFEPDVAGGVALEQVVVEIEPLNDLVRPAYLDVPERPARGGPAGPCDRVEDGRQRVHLVRAGLLHLANGEHDVASDPGD